MFDWYFPLLHLLHIYRGALRWHWLHNNSVCAELRCRCSWAQMSATPKHKYKYSLMCFTLIFSNIVLHKTSLRLSSLTHISASSLAFHAIALEFFSGGFCPFYAHCSPCSTVQRCWSAAAAESERTSGQRAKQIHSYIRDCCWITHWAGQAS